MVVELGAGDRAAPVGQGAAGPRQQQRLAEAVGPQALVDGVRAQPVLEAEPLQLADRPRRQPVAAGLVAREDRRVREHDVRAAARRPRRGRRPRRAGAHDEHVGPRRGAHPRFSQRRTDCGHGGSPRAEEEDPGQSAGLEAARCGLRSQRRPPDPHRAGPVVARRRTPRRRPRVPVLSAPVAAEVEREPVAVEVDRAAAATARASRRGGVGTAPDRAVVDDGLLSIRHETPMLLSAPPLLHRPSRERAADDVHRLGRGAGRARGPRLRPRSGPRRSQRLPTNVESTIFSRPPPREDRAATAAVVPLAGRVAARERQVAGRPVAGRPGRRSATWSSAASGRRCSGRGSGARRTPLEGHQSAAVDRPPAGTSLTTFAVRRISMRHRLRPAVEPDHATAAHGPHHGGRRAARRRRTTARTEVCRRPRAARRCTDGARHADARRSSTAPASSPTRASRCSGVERSDPRYVARAVARRRCRDGLDVRATPCAE